MRHARIYYVHVLSFILFFGLNVAAYGEWIKEYDSYEDEGIIGPYSDSLGPWGEVQGNGITSWYFITAAPDAKIERLSVYVNNITGSPQNHTWGYEIKIGATSDTQITTDPDSQVSAYTTVHGNWNPGTGITGNWNDIDLQTSYVMSSSSNYILKFKYLGDSNPGSEDNYWQSRADYLDHYCFAHEQGGSTVRYGYLPRLRMYGDRTDLQLMIFQATPDVLWSDRIAHFTLDVANTGDADITENYDVALSYRGHNDPGWTYMGDPKEVQGHLAGAWQTLSWHWFPEGTGVYYFQVEIDCYEEVFETDENNNQQGYYYLIKDPPSPPVKTLILADSEMMVSRGYALEDVNSLMENIAYFANNDPRGQGVVIDFGELDSGSELIQARDNQWDANMGTAATKNGTNAYVDEIDELIENKRHYHYPDLKQVIIVGSHEIIPMQVRLDEVGNNGARETTWGGGAYDFLTDMYYLYTIPAPGNYLTDAKYADLSYLDDSEDAHLTRELSIGRLVETPTQISAIIDNYFAVNGNNPMNDIACIGSLDFMDGARRAAANLTDYGYSPDTTLIAEDINSTVVPTKMESKNDFIYFGGHSDYNKTATKGDGWWDENTWHKSISENFWAGHHETMGDTNEIDSLATAVVIAAGCHGGALLPNKTYHEPNVPTEYRDFPEEFASKGTIAYLGATGYTWISVDDGGTDDTETLKSEVLCAKTAQKFAAGSNIGQAYRLAANEYYLDARDTLTNRDKKVLGIHQVYGIPGYQKFSAVQPPPGGWHFGNTDRTTIGDTTVVQTTLTLDAWPVDANGIVRIPGADYTGGPENPVLPVILFTEPNIVPSGSTLKKAYLYESLSTAYEFANIIPTEALGQRDANAPAQAFTPPGTDCYPLVPYSGYTILSEGGIDAEIGLVIRPVQFNPSMSYTRVWEEMILEFEYDTTQYAFYDSLTSGNMNKWTTTETGSASIKLDHTDVASTPYCLQVLGASGAGDRVKVESYPIDIDFSKPYRIKCLFLYSNFHWDRFLVFGHIRLLLDQTWLPIRYDPVGDNSFSGNLIGPPFDTYPADTWMSIEVCVDPNAREYEIFINDSSIGTVGYQETVEPSTRIWFEDNGSATNYLNARYDDFLVMGAAGAVPVQSFGDIVLDGHIDLADFALMATNWTKKDCTEPDWCQGCDLNKSGAVSLEDLRLLTEFWMTSY